MPYFPPTYYTKLRTDVSNIPLSAALCLLFKYDLSLSLAVFGLDFVRQYLLARLFYLKGAKSYSYSKFVESIIYLDIFERRDRYDIRVFSQRLGFKNIDLDSLLNCDDLTSIDSENHYYEGNHLTSYSRDLRSGTIVPQRNHSIFCGLPQLPLHFVTSSDTEIKYKHALYALAPVCSCAHSLEHVSLQSYVRKLFVFTDVSSPDVSMRYFHQYYTELSSNGYSYKPIEYLQCVRFLSSLDYDKILVCLMYIDTIVPQSRNGVAVVVNQQFYFNESGVYFTGIKK